MRRTATTLGLLVLVPVLLGKGCGDQEDPDQTLPDGTSTGTLGTTSITTTGTTTDVTTTETLCKVAWGELPYGWGGGVDIVVADPDLRTQVVVARSENVDLGDPTTFEVWTWEYEGDLVFSPRGDEVAFFARTFFPDGQETYELWIAPIDGSGRRRITPGGYLRGGPIAWSPDGSTLAFQAQLHEVVTTNNSWRGQNEIFTVGADGSNLTQLTDGTRTNYRDAFQPSWSPSGDALAWYDGHGNLMLRVGSGSPSAIPNVVTSDSPDNPISWSADGQTLYYFSASQEIRQVGRTGANEALVASGSGRFPKLSPAGDKFLRGGWIDVNVVNIDGTGAAFLGDYGARETRWGPGETAWVCGNDPELVEIPVDGSPIVFHSISYDCTGPISHSSHCFTGAR